MSQDVDDLLDELEEQIDGDEADAAASSDSGSQHPPIPGLHFLGAGYDVFGRYASASSVKANIFDFSGDRLVDQQLYDESLPQVRSNVENAFMTMPTEIKLFYACPAGVQFKERFQAELEFTEEGSISEEQESLAAHVDMSGEYGLFSGEMHARYNSTATRLSSTKFYSATAVIRYFDLSMANYPLHPRQYVRPQVAQDLNNVRIEPKQLFDKYGTHYLYSVTIGSKIVYGHTVDTSKTSSSYDASAELKASYGSAGGEVAGGGGAETKHASEQAHDAIDIKFYAEGVSDAQIEAAGDINNKPLQLLKEGWHNPTLVDFPTDALKPIWELCESKRWRDRLRDAFEDYARENGTSFGHDDYLVPLYLLRHKGTTCYRLESNRNGPDEEAGKLELVGGERPSMLVFKDERPNTVPLYAYRSTSDPRLWRYETDRWASFLAQYARGWKKASGTPVGWVYDGLRPAPPSGSVDVFIHFPEYSGGTSRFLYSTDSADGRDRGGWRPLRTLGDEVPRPSGNVGYQAPADADAAAVLSLESNVHWRAVQE